MDHYIFDAGGGGWGGQLPKEVLHKMERDKKSNCAKRATEVPYRTNFKKCALLDPKKKHSSSEKLPSPLKDIMVHP